MAEDTGDEAATEAPSGDATRQVGRHPGDRRYPQRNFAERLFPGPSPAMSAQINKRIQGLLQPVDEKTLAKLRQEQQRRRPGTTATSEDITGLHDSIEEQNELLRAILASSVDTQTDARATAQNSRTFAWAGTAIALLTLVATVIAVIAAVRG